MNTKQWTALGVTLGVFALAALLLIQVGASQRLAAPGLRLSSEPTYMTGGELVRTQSVTFPANVAGFEAKPLEVSKEEVDWLPKDTLFGRCVYSATNGFEAQASVVLMGTDRTSIHKPQFCLDAQGWHIEKSEVATIPMARPHPYDLKVMKLTANKRLLNNQGQPITASALYVYWFVADKLLTPHHGERMWWMARDLVLTGVLQRWAYVSYFTAWPGTSPALEEAAFAQMKELVAASVPEFQLAAGTPLEHGTIR
jgi:hypothetical protein